MSKLRIGILFAIAAATAAWVPAAAALPVGPFAARCEGHAGAPAMLVRVTGFKARSGTVRVQSYGGDPTRFFDKGSYLKRIDVPVPSAGPLDICLPVPAPGSYAVSVRHDVNGSGKSDRTDGGGMSGNPHLSLFDLMFKRKPDPGQVSVPVDHGVRVVPIVLNYLDGGSFRPVASR